MLRKLGSNEGPILNSFLECYVSVMNLFLSLSMAYHAISCRQIAKNTQIFNITKFAILSGLTTSEITKNAQ